MSIQSDLIAAVETFGTAYAAAVANLSWGQRALLRTAIARRLASAGAGSLLADPKAVRTARLGVMGRAGYADATAGQFSAEVTRFVP